MIARLTFDFLQKRVGSLLLAFLLFPAIAGLGADTNTPITTCAGVLQTASEPESDTHPVRLRGVITCYAADAQLCFVQDETAGVYIFPISWAGDFAFGDVVEVEGWSGKGRFSPVVHRASLRSTGEKSRPVAKRISLEDLNNGQYDSQFVALEGVVQSLEFGGGVSRLTVWNAGSSVIVLVFNCKSSLTNLTDATVRLEGVGGTFFAADRFAGFGVFLQEPSQLEILRPAPDLSRIPTRSTRTLAAYSPEGLDHRVRVRGVVTVAWPGEAIFLQDDAGAIRIEAAGNEDRGVRAGDLVEACGFVRNLLRNPSLGETVLRKTGSKSIPDPHFLTVRDIVGQPPKGQLVVAEGSVINVRAFPALDWAIIDIERDSQILSALCCPEKLSDIRRGSQIRVSGAWSAPPRRLRDQIGPVVWVNSPSSILVLAPPRHDVVPSLRSDTSLWLGSTAAALILAVVFASVAIRNAVRASSLEKAGANRQMESERDIQRLHESREQLGRDLHDRIIQSIYAIGLNIEECARNTAIDAANIKARLAGALKDINSVIGELRNVILGLETNAIQPKELRTALKSLALALGNEESSRIRIATDEDALAALTPTQATELVYIAREALSNSVRHGNASATTFRLELHDERIRFTIEDDGRGFDVKIEKGKGFGLRNMAKRATQLDAKFSIESKVGQGTRVVLDIPRQRQHF